MSNSTASLNQDSISSEPLYHVKLLSALRSGDPALIHPFLAEIGKDRRKSTEYSEFDTGAAALHLALRCGTVSTVGLLLSHRAISPNGVHPPGSGTTPLHLAASLGRVDVVKLLLEQDLIDDTIRDDHGRTCKDVARGKEIVRAIEDSRSFLNASYRSLLRSYILSAPSQPPSDDLVRLLQSPRVQFVNLSYLDDGSGTSLLHEAAQRKDLRLIELAVRAGADVFVRNRKGKMAYEGTGKDDRVRVFLRQYANHDATLIQSQVPVTEPPALKGYLNKYTNVAKGYNPRWFVLHQGILSYYRHQEDETVASRGSISMRTAIIKTFSNEQNRFEVHSTPSRGHQSIQKWYMKANHPVEASRWIQALNKSLEWYKREGAIDSDLRRKSGESDQSAFKPPSSIRTHKLSLSAGTLLRRGRISTGDSYNGSIIDGSGATGASSEISGDASPKLHNHSPTTSRDGDADEDRSRYRDDSSSESSRDKAAADLSILELHGNATSAQMELTTHLLNDFQLPPDDTRLHELHKAVKESFSIVNGMLNEYVQMVRQRDEFWSRQLEKEKMRQAVWEESLKTVVQEGENLEKELRARSRKRGSRFFDSSSGPSVSNSWDMMGGASGGSTLKNRRASQFVQFNVPTIIEPTSPTESTAVSVAVPVVVNDEGDTDEEEDEFFDAIEAGNIPNLTIAPALASPRTPTGSSTWHSYGTITDITNSSSPTVTTVSTNKNATNQSSNSLRLPSGMVLSLPISSLVALEPYLTYQDFRESLDLKDERPSVSLWSVLKHSIGKDLTKISFPVFFNEPTSMLQRMAEDMEFSECLDAAAKEADPLRRIAYVGAFAMSNYSSTIGRIAKPFNPMLGETFEYVRFDRQYCYVSEQVSHHPPISACWAESPTWRYYGEVDAQNKFMGKSFEIRPTGIAHANLLIPAEIAGSACPTSQERFAEGKLVEHYSWKKVTTNVSGFLLGSPTIDHYGDMVIQNHRTGDRCILTFKPRGWRGRDAFEIFGQVLDASGRVAYEIAGRWNSQLVARAVGKGAVAGTGGLNPDISVADTVAEDEYEKEEQPEHILLWRNTDKPPGSPFNLTPFAITLNDCPPHLKPLLCPTDCRLRPDQRAFELGQYELANDLKTAQEEKQRATRKLREMGDKQEHRPRWFREAVDGDTGERVWQPVRAEDGRVEYWVEREKVWKEGRQAGLLVEDTGVGAPGGAGVMVRKNGPVAVGPVAAKVVLEKAKVLQAKWKDVEPIFVEEPEQILV